MRQLSKLAVAVVCATLTLAGLLWEEHAVAEPSLAELIKAEAGSEPALLAITKEGALIARTPSEKWSKTLIPSGVLIARMDPNKMLTWLWMKDTPDSDLMKLAVLDLRSPSADVVVIATGLAANIPWSVDGWTIGVGFASDVIGVANLVWSETPTFEVEEGLTQLCCDASSLNGVVITEAGKKWLAANHKRPITPIPNASPPRQHIAGINADACEHQALCGEAIPFHTTGLLLTIVSHSCGDGCYIDCVLYDPAKKRYRSPTATGQNWVKNDADIEAASCRDYLFSTDGRYYSAEQGGTICEAGGDCKAITDTFIQWIEPSPKVGH
jgi:hypothetical protein